MLHNSKEKINGIYFDFTVIVLLFQQNNKTITDKIKHQANLFSFHDYKNNK